MKLTIRKYQSDADYWKGRAFLREVFMLNDRRYQTWDVCRYDYWRWHGVANLEPYKIEDALIFWETPDGRVAAILNPESYGNAFLHIHPHLSAPGLEDEMVAAAEQYLTRPTKNGRKLLRIWVHECHTSLRELLINRGYTKDNECEYMRSQSLEGPVIAAQPPSGYAVRALNGDPLELLERCYASGLGFHEGDISVAVNNRTDTTWYQNIQNAPLYRRDLDIVAIAQDGSIASFCTVWFDDVCRTGHFEPVATVPTHQRKGLGKAVMSEGLRRLVKKGATKAFVGNNSVEAGALYASMGFTTVELFEPWIREF